MSRSELRKLGIVDEIIPAIQRARSPEDLEALGLSDAHLERLRFRFLQRLTDSDAGGTCLSRRARSVDHLADYLEGKITDLLLDLSVSQLPIVGLRGDGPILIRGVAGSGKTAVTLYRIAKLLSDEKLAPPRVLYVTYNKALASAAVELLRVLGFAPGEVEVSTIDRWCRRNHGKPPRAVILKGARQKRLVALARDRAAVNSKKSKLWKYPLSFWVDEIHRIKGNGIGSLDEYLELSRAGSGKALNRTSRSRVWRVAEAYKQLLADRRECDWDDVRNRAYERLRARGDSSVRFDHVFVDEAQDFTPVALRLAAHLARPKGNIVVSFDPAQSIYERGFRWKSCGIQVHGSRSFTLQENHRNPREVLELGRRVLDEIQRDPDEVEEGEAQGSLDPVSMRPPGREPERITAPPAAMFKSLATDIKKQIAEYGVAAGKVSVLCFRRATRDRAFEALQEAGILTQKQDEQVTVRLGDPSVKVMTIHAAKGLEFPLVYLVSTSSELSAIRRSRLVDRGVCNRDRKLLYTALTRSMWHLVEVHEEGSPSAVDVLTEALDASAVGRQGKSRGAATGNSEASHPRVSSTPEDWPVWFRDESGAGPFANAESSGIPAAVRSVSRLGLWSVVIAELLEHGESRSDRIVSCGVSNLATKVMRWLKILTKGKPRQEVVRIIEGAIGGLSRKTFVKRYGKEQHRVRLTDDCRTRWNAYFSGRIGTESGTVPALAAIPSAPPSSAHDNGDGPRDAACAEPTIAAVAVVTSHADSVPGHNTESNRVADFLGPALTEVGATGIEIQEHLVRFSVQSALGDLPGQVLLNPSNGEIRIRVYVPFKSGTEISALSLFARDNFVGTVAFSHHRGAPMYLVRQTLLDHHRADAGRALVRLISEARELAQEVSAA